MLAEVEANWVRRSKQARRLEANGRRATGDVKTEKKRKKNEQRPTGGQTGQTGVLGEAYFYDSATALSRRGPGRDVCFAIEIRFNGVQSGVVGARISFPLDRGARSPK